MSILLGLLGGIGIFLYGMHLLSKGMQKVAVSKMKHYLSSFTSNRFKGLLAGIVATFFMQSSTATSIIVVGLVGSSVISLWQAFGVILGSSIGTTLTVQILAFNITEYSAIFIFLGSFFVIFLKRTKLKSIGQALVGFGFIFFGIGAISEAMAPLSENREFIELFVGLQEKPILLLLLSALLTFLMHNSATVIVLAMSLATTGVLSIASIFPVVLGANLGSPFPALLSSLASTREGKKVALSYFNFKFIGVLLCLPLIYFAEEVITFLPGGIERKVANFHSLFNIFVAVLFLPLVGVVSRLMDKVLPVQKEKEAIKIDQSLIDYPAEALDQMHQLVSKLAHTVDHGMVKQLPSLLEHDQTVKDEVFKKEKYVDEAYKTIQNFLLKIGQQDLTEDQSDKEVELLYILNDLEHVGDVVKNIGEVVSKKAAQGQSLNQDDLQDIFIMSKEVNDSFTMAIEAFEKNDLVLAKEVINKHAELVQIEKDLRFTYFNKRIERNQFNDAQNDSYLDIIAQLLRINTHSVNISQTLLGIV